MAEHLARAERWLRLPLAVVAGAAFALGQAPYDLWALALVGLVAVVILLERGLVARHAALTGWAFGLGYFGLGLAWIVEPFQVDAAAHGWMAPFALIGLSGGLALFWAVPFWATAKVGRIWALAPFWALAELARTYVLTGFPWALLPYVWAPSDAVHWLSVMGPHGLSLVTVGLALLAARTVTARSWRRCVATLAGLAVLLGGGAFLRPAQSDLDGRPIVRLVQPNVAQHEKWDRALIPIFFDRQIRLTEQVPAPDLVIWPETALPMLLDQAEEAMAVMRDAAGPVPVIFGVQRAAAGEYHNSLVAMLPQGARQVYDKHHLVPFGEYMPAAALFQRFDIAGLAARAAGGYAPGPGAQLLDLGALGQALPLICYEAVFPQNIHAAPARPDFLIQITNDAWFGQWSGPYQHLAQARMRAIEQGLPLVRAANTGVSAVIDGGGRVLAHLPLNQEGALDHALPPPLAPTVYARSGDLPIAVFLIFLMLWAVLPWPRNTD